jgi:hypothetical protein
MWAQSTGLTESNRGNRGRLASLGGDRAAAPIAEGDAARDRRDWPSAANHYRIAVSIDPSLAAIWVQLGHALKESGDLIAGEAAYRRAWSLEPDTADSALQLGHVLKLQHKRPEAIAWYKTAMVLDRCHADPVCELLALGVTRAELNATLAERLPDASPPAGIRPTPAISWDVNTHCVAGVLGLWRRGLIAATGWSGTPPARGGIRLLLDPRPDDPFDFARRLQSDATPVLVLPLVMPLRHPAWFSTEAVAECARRLRALLPVAAGICVADNENSTLLGVFCQANGITPPPIAVLAFPPCRRVAGGNEPTISARSAWAVLLPRDPVEQLQLLAAWRLVVARPKTLVLVAPPALGTTIQTTLTAGFACFPETEVSLIPALPEIGDFLTGLDHLLVPASREDTDPWIAAALAAGVSVKTAASPSIFARWGSAIGAYIDWRDAAVLARRWAGPVRTSTSGDAVFAGWGTALKSAVRAMPVPPSASLPAIGIGTFYFLGDGADSAAANGKPAQFGAGWGQILAEGAGLSEARRDPHPDPPHKGGGSAAISSLPLVGRVGVGVDEPLTDLPRGPMARGVGSAMLRFRLADLLGRSFRCRVLVRNIGTAPDDLDATLGTGEIRKTLVPAGRWRWIDWSLANPAAGARFGEISITMLASGSAGARLIVVGFLIFPEDADHYWFEFMDEVSRCRYKFLHRITI